MLLEKQNQETEGGGGRESIRYWAKMLEIDLEGRARNIKREKTLRTATDLV